MVPVADECAPWDLLQPDADHVRYQMQGLNENRMVRRAFDNESFDDPKDLCAPREANEEM